LLDVPLALPSTPRVVALLQTELLAREPDLRKLCQLVGTDPALAADVLRVANAPGMALPAPVATVSEALAVLGMEQVRSVVACATVGSSTTALPGVNLQHFWRYSLGTARVARSLAVGLKLHQGLGYTAGLLHALGELAMHHGMPQAMAALNRSVPPLDRARVEAERDSLGYTFAEVSAGLARRWGLPQPLVDALAAQNMPFEGDAFEPLGGVVHLAAWRARAREAGLSERQLAVSFPDVVGVTLGLDIDMVLQQTPFDWVVAQEERLPIV
jgi:HD-like signal output (HDOD) protein